MVANNVFLLPLLFLGAQQGFPLIYFLALCGFMLILLVEKFFTWLSERASGNFEKIDDSEELQDLGAGDIDDMEAGGDEDAQAIMLDGGDDGGGADGAELSVNGDAPAIKKAQKKKKKKKHGTHDSASHGHSQGHGHSHGLPLNVESPLLPYILTVGAASVPVSLTAAAYSHVATGLSFHSFFEGMALALTRRFITAIVILIGTPAVTSPHAPAGS